MRLDCLNIRYHATSNYCNFADHVVQYKKVVSRRMGLRRLPKKKPVGKKEDIYHLLIVYLVRCTKVYRDEKQRLMIAISILLSYLTGYGVTVRYPGKD